MKVLKLFVIALFAAAFASALVSTRVARSQSGPTEAPAGFDNQTNGFEPQGTPVPPNTDPVPGDFESDKAIFDVVDVIEDGLGPVYNAQSCRECHQNPVSGGVSQISELRAGHTAPDGTFVDAPGGSIIHSRAINVDIQERVPDGPRLVCAKNGSTMFLMGFDGGQYGEVVNSPTPVVPFASFSHDDRKYVYAAADSSGSNQIFTQNVDGTGRTQLTSFTGASAAHPQWSPDGTKIAFASNASGNMQIWSMNPDGTGQTNLTNDGALGGNDYPTWSPDSSKIAFQRLRNSATTNVWVMDANGANQTNLTGQTAFTFSGNPSYSPDGTQIAFQTNRDGNNEVYKMTSSGASQTRLTNNSANDGAPAWSPDGDIIAFHSTRSGGSSRIWIMKTDGTLPTLLVKQGFNSYSNPQWSHARGGRDDSQLPLLPEPPRRRLRRGHRRRDLPRHTVRAARRHARHGHHGRGARSPERDAHRALRPQGSTREPSVVLVRRLPQRDGHHQPLQPRRELFARALRRGLRHRARRHALRRRPERDLRRRP